MRLASDPIAKAYTQSDGTSLTRNRAEAKALPQIYPPNLWVKQELKGLCDERMRAERKLSIRFGFRLSQRP